MPWIKNLPTTIWVAAAAATLTCFSPVVGQVVTSPAATSSAVAPEAPVDAGTVTTPGGEAPATPQSVSPPNTPPVESSTPKLSAETVAAGATALGPAAVDKDGHTLYLSVLDSNDPPRSVCLSDKCLAAWKPLYAPDGHAKPTAGLGVDPSRLGVLERPDGRRQVTLGGWPLYRFDGDTSPGEVRGEGLKGTWHVIRPDGKRAR
ncbi:hypothetical protein [Kribbella sindirgiensis]|uniref:Lipoprotein with Yx(FWY)xxD motif n=1 Tax=Kribbella sindirgiensis TaxID=1124744 RepID=A0A4R0IMR9_9ACTN|nr:hypothetical protein [Kribbella sindirgiensis]TCC34913.1 hypothetical protein E0H50_13555 [Kribbella sindirgiensis]